MKLPAVLSLRLGQHLIQMLWMIGIWVVVLNIFIIIRFSGNPNAINPIDASAAIDISALFLNVTRGGIILGIAFSLLDIIFERRVFKMMSYGRIILIKSIFYLFIIILSSLLINLISFTIYHGSIDFGLWGQNVARLSWQAPLFYISLVSILINTFKQIDLKFGPGNLRKLLLGQYHKPRADHRIVMFLDLKSSTAIAEKLGHIQVSQLIQDCFTDLTIVRDYKAEIYQYVGDEVILTWSMADGLENLNCLKAYFEFQDLLDSRSEYYIKKYGVVPFFKAGLNVGDVTIAEVGQIKREIAFHGDTLNTASRIQGKCNDYNKSLLISQALKELIDGVEKLHIGLAGKELLRGKAMPQEIYFVDSVP